MTKKKQVNILGMHDVLTLLGHTQLWLREIPSGARFLVTWEGRILACYDFDRSTWRLRKDADLADDVPHGNQPGGTGLTALPRDMAFTLALRGY
ncbi:hypothetical protein ELZ88_24250 (plasmid) [Salmonella enterica subsp. enterica serovar Karamoja]|uniref:Uncharacterized protein n=1 Tax=Salmonella enterica subsp. enterica serovar Karamoja TaxID=2500153 RepID=A0A3Q9MLL2_SALET|nr:hypothetical protein [Salmonella enterica]AZT39651.1 hypothetical protein ELZ88_24250 [Salmonella enterica subsp. enterica serovar Karamoja]AZT44453.1 hypothetical protein EL007_24700 [Salmonella enterica subsp. enterica serovar Karamoja]